MIEPVRVSIDVAAPPDTVYAIFTRDIARWWPGHTHSLSAARTGQPPARVVFEAEPGGRVYELAADGTEHDWGRVGAAEPGQRLVFSWFVGRPEAQATEVEVTFTATDGGTRVALEHRNWERLAEDAQATRDGYAGGWPVVLGQYFAAAVGAALGDCAADA